MTTARELLNRKLTGEGIGMGKLVETIETQPPLDVRVCEEEYIRASSPAPSVSRISVIIMFSFFVTVLVLIQVIATSGGQSVSDERNQQVMMIHQVVIKIYYSDFVTE